MKINPPSGHPCLPPCSVISLSPHPCNSNHAPLWVDLTMSATCLGTAKSFKRAPGFRVNAITRTFAASHCRPRSSSNWSGFSGGAGPSPTTFSRMAESKAVERVIMKSNKWPNPFARATKERAVRLARSVPHFCASSKLLLLEPLTRVLLDLRLSDSRDNL